MSTADSPQVSRGLLILLGAVVGVGVLAALWFFVASPLLEDDPVAAPEPVATPQPTPEPEITPTPEPTPVPETAEFFTARDPFQQLVRPAVAAPAPDPGDPSPADPGTAPDPDDPAPGVRVGETSARLIEVFTDANGVERVRVEVNGTEHTPAEGETFAERFRVLDITNACATFLFGDNRFTLCEGETIRK